MFMGGGSLCPPAARFPPTCPPGRPLHGCRQRRACPSPLPPPPPPGRVSQRWCCECPASVERQPRAGQGLYRECR